MTPLTIAEVAAVKQEVLDRGIIYPSSVQAWCECPLRYVFDRRGERVSSDAQERGKKIHASVMAAIGLEDGICTELSPVVTHIAPIREELACGMVRLHKAKLYGTAEAHLTKVWRGVTVGGYIDILCEWHRHVHVTNTVIDIKTMSKLRADKIKKYVDSIQFSWYAYLSDAWTVFCMPIEALPRYETDGMAAWQAGRAYVAEHTDTCMKTYPDPEQEFKETCAVSIDRYMEWVTSSKLPKKIPNTFCKWCNAYLQGLCAGR